jgi:hypothetical protein
MASTSQVAQAQADEMMMKNYRTHLERSNQMNLQEIKNKNSDEVQRTLEDQELAKAKMNEAFQVRFTNEGQDREEKLAQIHLESTRLINDLKGTQEQELEKLKTQHKQRVEEFKRSSDDQITHLRNELAQSTSILHERAKQEHRKQEIEKANNKKG